MPRCLVIEDSPSMREVARQILIDLGVEAIECETAQEALSLCLAETVPDAVLLDWDLPEFGGPQFLRALRKQGPLRSKVVLCALENNREQFELARAAGVAAEILKPLDHDAVRQVFAEIGLAAGAAA